MQRNQAIKITNILCTILKYNPKNVSCLSYQVIKKYYKKASNTNY